MVPPLRSQGRINSLVDFKTADALAPDVQIHDPWAGRVSIDERGSSNQTFSPIRMVGSIS